MLTAMSLVQVPAISEAAQARAQDARAMEQYLHPNRSNDDLSPIDLSEVADTYNSIERTKLVEILKALSPSQRKELLALMFVGRGDTADFSAALEQASLVSDDGDVAYLAAKPLQRFLPAAIKKLHLSA